MTLGTITLKDFCFGSVSGCVKSIAIHGREKSIHGVKVIWCLSCLKMKRDPLGNKEGMLASIKYKYQRCWMSIMDPFMLSKWLPFSAKCPNPFPIGYWKNEKPSQTIQEEGRWTNCCRKPAASLSAHNSMESFPPTFHTWCSQACPQVISYHALKHALKHDRILKGPLRHEPPYVSLCLFQNSSGDIVSKSLPPPTWRCALTSTLTQEVIILLLESSESVSSPHKVLCCEAPSWDREVVAVHIYVVLNEVKAWRLKMSRGACVAAFSAREVHEHSRSRS